jgi:hypothetical protein
MLTVTVIILSRSLVNRLQQVSVESYFYHYIFHGEYT